MKLMPRPALLAGREELLAQVDARLSRGDGAGPQVLALCGLGGAGKTSVALEYAYRHLAEFGLVWQFAAENAAVLAAGFSELAAELGPRDLLSRADPVAQVHGALAARPGDWLLVFDNVPAPEAVQTVLPPAGGGRVLITSRNPLWGAGQAIEVPMLEQKVAAAFLVNRTRAADEEAAAWDLASELDGLPLALEQAAAYMQATGRSITEYLALFQRQRLGLLARGEPAGYDKRVTTTWAMAFEQLQQAVPQATGLLRLVACCASEAIPLDLLLRPRPGLKEAVSADVGQLLTPLLEDPFAVDDAVAALRTYSLISRPHGGAVSVHRLVQAVTLAQLPADLAAKWRQAAGFLIEAAIPSDRQQPTAWPVYAALLPHAQAALAHSSVGMARVANYLGQIGSYSAARALQRQVLDEREQFLGAEDPGTLDATGDLAYWTGQAGDGVGARKQYSALLPVRERVLGPEHPDTLKTRGTIAFWTGRTGDAVGARDQYAALLPIRERVLGPEAPDSLSAKASLAYWTGMAGNAAAARDQAAALLPIISRVLGSLHPDTLSARASLARWTGEAGDASAARDQYGALMRVREQVLGPEHPQTLATRGNLANWTGQAGDAAGARDQYAALLPALERVLGSVHPDTLAVGMNLSCWARQATDGSTAAPSIKGEFT
jgi:hypothetical protein